MLLEDYLFNSVIIQKSISLNNELNCEITLEEVMLIVEIIKITNNLGDMIESLITGLIASLLPTNNIIKTLYNPIVAACIFIEN